MEQSGEMLSRGVAALKSGQKADALRILKTVVDKDSDNVNGWLWLAASVSTPGETLSCLNRVLALDPHNAKALAGIQWANAELERERSKLPESLPSFQMTLLQAPPSAAPGDALFLNPPMSPATPVRPQAAGQPVVHLQSHFLSNVVIVTLSLTLVLGLLVIGGLLYAWLG
jgi:hypothetical protein